MSEKILIIEDDATVTRLIKEALEIEEYEVVTASNGLEGLSAATNEEPDLVILDLMVPGLDGYQICQELRRNSETADLPILIVSAKSREQDIELGLRMGADFYLTKPFDMADLLNNVSKLL